MAWRPVLCEKNRAVTSLTQDIEGVPSGTPLFESGQAWGATRTITLTLTEDEAKQLFSAVMTGADITYGDDAQSVVWLLWLAIEES